ncbi:MAG: FAD-dependent oxidoreductase [Acidobacteriota bacterium]
MKKLTLSLLGLLLFTQCAHQEQYDIVIYGGTSAGIAAAVQAARMDKSVILIEPGKYLGGLTSGGLGKTDSGNKSVIGGISREFYQRLKQHYDNPDIWKHENPSDYEGYSSSDDAIWGFEPHAAEMIYNQMLKEKNILVVINERLDLVDGTVVKDGQIASIKMESGLLITGRMFIDATYEGDLMAKAGVSYTVGRESNQAYGETLNGVQKAQAIYHQFVNGVDPYIVPGDPSRGLLPGVHDGEPGEDGQGDKLVQAYCFRMCLTDVEENRIAYPKPEGYEESRYELLLRNFEAGEDGMPWLPGMMPNRKTDTNNRTGFSTDNIGMNYDYPDADYETRAKINKEHEIYQKGLMWTLANNPRVPAHIRTEISRWGLAKDEFIDNDNWPHQLYIREARRMVGEYVVTENDCRRLIIVEDPVGMGSYTMDSHNCQRYVTPEGFVKNEGDVEVSPGGAYLISYRAMVPKKEEIRNLLVPVCLSASHIAYGSIRMEPVFMILGQSAATAAVSAIDKKVAVQDICYPELRGRLM